MHSKSVGKDKQCKYCQQEINNKAQVCHLCGRDQRKWINELQYLSTSMAIIMVLAVIIQAFIANKQITLSENQNKLSEEQYKESKLKRLEAEDVLKKAVTYSRLAFTNTSTNSYKTKINTEKVLLFAKNETRKAVDKSINTLKVADKNVQEVNSATQNIKKDINNAGIAVARQLDDSNKLIKKADDEFNTINNDINTIKIETTSELEVLKKRNGLTAIADYAISAGDRKSYNTLVNLCKTEADNIPAVSELLRVKNFFGSFNRLNLDEQEIKTKEGVVLKDMKTEELLIDLINNQDWHIRGAIAKHLMTRKEKKVAEALLESIKYDSQLDVMKASLDSFTVLTGYKRPDVFDSSPDLPVIDWWNKNKDNIGKDLK